MACRLLVWASTATPGRFHRGDVSDILSGAPFVGHAIWGNPDWAIIDMDGAPSDYQHLLEEVRHEDGSMALHRARYIDLDDPAQTVVEKPVPPHPKVIR